MTDRPVVVTLNTSDVGGGAERIATTLASGYRARGWQSWLVVGEQHTDDPWTFPIWSSGHIDHSPYGRLRSRVPRRVRKAVLPRLGLEDHEFPQSHHIVEATGAVPDVVHAHNLHGPWFDIRALAPLSQRVPVVVTLHDSWLFTGHCAQPGACERWRTGCGRCPDLAAEPAVARDATRRNLRRKAGALTGARLHVACPSLDILRRVEASAIAGAVVEARHIPNGIDTDVFSPGDRAAARAALGVAGDEIVLLFVARDPYASAYKDPATVEAAAAIVAGAAPAPLRRVVLGGGAAHTPVTPDAPFRLARPGRVPSAEVARWMQAANVLVHAAHDETHPLVLLEAMASATPVVATDVGGIAEVVAGHGRVVAPRDPAAMAAAVLDVLAEPPDRAMAAAGHVRANFGTATMIDRYVGWFDELRATAPQAGISTA